MKAAKRKKLEAAGFRVGTADEFLELSKDESRQVAESLPPCKLSLRIPEGWSLEPLERQPDHVLLTTPSPGRYMATIDFRARGFRPGYSVSGRLVGDEWNKRRTKPSGRGWKQALVDAAVASLQELLQ